MGQLFFAPSLIDQDAELHVNIGQLRKGVVVTAECESAQRQKAFLGNRKHMRLHSADFVQLDSPILQSWIGSELSKLFVVDREDFRNDKRCCFADLRKQILNLSDACEVFIVRAVLSQLQ